jgi:mannitol 2-dehydrogenase
VVRLNRATLRQRPIAAPSYDRPGLQVGIAHFVVGGFHRAHHAMYLDRLPRRGLARECGIGGIRIMPAGRRMRDLLTAPMTRVVSMTITEGDDHSDRQAPWCGEFHRDG